MKIVWIVLVIGLLLIYLIDMAFKIYEINLEMIIHSLVRFVAGFVILGVWGLGKKKFKLKICLYIILTLLLADDLYEYIYNIDNLTFGMIFHDMFMIFWGTVIGFFLYKHYRQLN